MLSLSVPRIFKIAGRASALKSLFSNRRDFYILQHCRKLYYVQWYVPKNSSSRNFQKFFFNWSGVECLQPTQVLRLLKKNSQPNFLRCFENFRKFLGRSLMRTSFLVNCRPTNQENSWDNVCCEDPFLQKQKVADSLQSSFSIYSFSENTLEVSKCTQEDCTTYILLGKFQKFLEQLFFESLMDGCFLKFKQPF